jgi:hypothetical protein
VGCSQLADKVAISQMDTTTAHVAREDYQASNMICDDVYMVNNKNENSLQDDWLSCSEEIPFSLQCGKTLISSHAASQAQYMVHVHGTLTNIVVVGNFDTGSSVPCTKTLINPASSFVSNEEIDKSVNILKKFWRDLSLVEQEEASHNTHV